jgi:hypothetical protein
MGLKDLLFKHKRVSIRLGRVTQSRNSLEKNEFGNAIDQEAWDRHGREIVNLEAEIKNIEEDIVDFCLSKVEEAKTTQQTKE